mmetsp:Transcript_45963/g.111945  ORF Transcript_45963/g.111945 Transcript_45963/m.111945 type:complete len:312 (+) Transcript_45963:68-1003(+)
MSYRPHKRKKASTLTDSCIEKIANNMEEVFKPGVLSVALRQKILAYLRGSPLLITLPEGFFDEEWEEADLSCCELAEGTLSQIGRTAPYLLTINLRQCSGVELLLPKGFANLCEGCRELRCVDLVGCMTVSDVMLGCLHKLCSSLRVVRLGGCISLTPEALAKFIKHAGANLQELDLSGCRVTDHVVREIVTHCKQLTTLALGYCDEVSHMAWCILLRTSCKNVRSLRLTRVSTLTDPLLLLVGRHLGGTIEDLDITGCKQIKDDSVTFVAIKCRQLKTLTVRNCEKVTSDLLDKLPRINPKVTIVQDRKR